MYKFLSKNGQTVAFGIGIALTLIFLAIAIGGLEDFNMMSEEKQFGTSIFNFGFFSAIFLTIACAAAWVLFGLVQTASNFKAAIVGIIGVAALLGLFFIIYSTVNPAADSQEVLTQVKEFDVSDGESKLISGALITTIVLFALAFVTFIVFEIINIFK